MNKKCINPNCILINNEQHLIISNSKENLKNLQYLFICDYFTDDIIENVFKIFNEKQYFQDFLSKHKYAFISIIPCLVDDIENLDIECDIFNRIFSKLKDINNLEIICLGPKSLKKLKFYILKTLDHIINEDGICIYPFLDTIYFNNKIEKQIQKKSVMKFKETFDKEYKLSKNVLNSEIEKNENIDSIFGKSKNIFYYNIPKTYMSEDYRLEDIQYNFQNRSLLLMFRNKDNKKYDYMLPLPEDNYYWYESDKNIKWICDVNKLILKKGSYNNRNQNQYCYESDLKIQDKFSCDYYLQKRKECESQKKNVLYFDIEVFTEGSKFPKAELAERPINAISFKFDDDEPHIFLLENEHIDKNYKDIIKNYKNLTLFKNEAFMLQNFWKTVHKLNPTFLAGWNSNNFDNLYFYNRLKRLNINPNIMSKYKYVSLYQNYFNETSNFGYISIDLMQVYKALTYTNEPSYTLDYISQKELSESKVKYEGDLNSTYQKDLKTFIDYSIQDTILLYKLNEKLLLIDQIDELRRICGITFSSVMSTVGQADGLFYCHLKEQGKTFINSKHSEKQWIKGAYVRDPKGGIYDYVVDLDYTSLYPSITNSCNLGPNTYIAKIDQNFARLYLYERDKTRNQIVTITFNPIFNTKTEKISFDKFEKFLKENDAIVTSFGTIFKGHDKEKSIFYDIINKLFKQRKEYKKLMNEAKAKKDELNKKIYYSKQMAYKILLNSLYGILANEHFRFYNLDLASTITCTGRELIRYAGEYIDQYMHTMNSSDIKISVNFFENILEDKDFLLYCDTDSLFLWMENFLQYHKIPVTTENIIKYIDKIQNFLNNDLLNYFCQLHNIKLKYSMFEMKNELLAKRYYTLSCKKHYALHVIKSEGVDVDYIDIKGLEIIRSDIPEFSQKMLDEILQYIMYNEEVDVDGLFEIKERYKEKVYNLIEQRDVSVCKTVSFSKKLKEYKTIPQHIKGMLMFNLLEYDFFVPGHRGILVPIKGIDFDVCSEKIKKNYKQLFSKKYKLDDLNCIVLPETYDKIPKYYVLDVKKIIDFSIEERFNLFLEPLILKNDSLLIF